MAELSKTASTLLDTIAQAGSEGTQVDRKKVNVLVKAGLVEINENMIDDKGRIAAWCTDDGYIQASSAYEAPVETETKETSMTDSNISGIVSDAPMPARRGPSRSSPYPFDALEENQSFFVAATEKMPNPAKSLGGTVNSANRRWSEPTGQMTTVDRGVNAGKEVPERRAIRKFTCRSVADGEAWGFPGVAGAAVFRLPLDGGE